MKFSNCFLLLALISTMGMSAQDEVITDTTQLRYNFFFATYPYYRVNYTYTSVAPDGVTPVTLSSALIFPQKVFERTERPTIDGTEYDATGLLLNNHYTMTQQSDAPTQTSSMSVEGAFSVLGPRFIIISPDGYGFGTTVHEPQAYLMADITARNAIDAVKAARRLLAQMGYSYGDLFTQLGYSQGGHSAMAVQRYVDTHESDAEGIPYLNYSLCGGGPYDVSAMLDTLMLPGATFRYPCALPLILQGQIGGANLSISYSDCFRSPLDTKAIEWLNAKSYTSEQINDSIYAYVGGDASSGVLVSNILCTENFTPSNSKMVPLFQAIQNNSLVSGWKPDSRTRFYVAHSSDDEIVPFFCMEHMCDFLQNEGGVGNDRLITDELSGSHLDAATTFVVNSISKLRIMEEEYLNGTFEPTSIQQPMLAHTDAPQRSTGWFNLQGQRLPAKPQVSGLYIFNGKKVWVGH